MKGDISGEFHDRRKNCSGLRAQQGRVLTDGDFNAALDIVDDALETLVRTMVCAAGSPDDGFRITGAGPATLDAPFDVDTFDMTIAPGSFVLGGRAHLLRTAQTFLRQDNWVSLPLDSDDVPDAPVEGRADLAWLEAVERPFRAVEDREIQERALGSADTSTRLRPQLRVRVLTDTPPDCETAALTLRSVLTAGPETLSEDGTEILSAARLGVFFTDDNPVLDPCAPRSAAGYLGAENHTLKIMLTAPDRFVWAIDHGEPLYRVQVDASDGRVVFLTEPRDPVLWPVPEQVIEILPWDVFLPNGEKTAAPLGYRARITGNYEPPNGSTDHGSIAWDGSLPADWQDWLDALPEGLEGEDDPNPRYFYARIWSEPEGAGTDQPTSGNISLPNLGVGLSFGPDGLAGDFWTVSLRTDAPELVVPWRLKIDEGDTPEAPPNGPRRFIAPLAVIRWREGPDGPVADIHDCRNRFRRLCQIKGCCTYHVGDGNVSFGEFNDVAEAVAALPEGGGEICLLPGIHDAPVDLSNKRNITIHGCGRRTILRMGPPDPDGAASGPAIDLTDAENIVLRDFVIETVSTPCVGALAVGVRKRATTRQIKLLRMRMSVAAGAAVLLTRVDDCDITECRIAATLGDPDVRRSTNAEPLVFFAGQQIRMRDCVVIAAERFTRLGGHPGGVHVGGLSRFVLIEGNLINGGAGNGITLGSVRPRPTQDPRDPERPFFRPWIVISDDGCPKIDLPGTGGPDDVLVDPDGPGRTILQSEGPLFEIDIRRNRIFDQGASGVSVAHWFIAREQESLDELDDIDIRNLSITDNRIYNCAQIDLLGVADIDAAFNSAIGGVTLAMTTDLDISRNEIRGCGRRLRAPVCGIYVRDGIRLRIDDNRLTENGRTATLRDPLLVGNTGGIVIGQVEDGVAGTVKGDLDALLGAPALAMSGNRVVSAEGRALEVTGQGQMLVHGNTLTAHGNNSLAVLRRIYRALVEPASGSKLTTPGENVGQMRAAIDQIGGSAVLIINTGINPNMLAIAASVAAISGLQQTTSVDAAGNDTGGEASNPARVPYNDSALLTIEAKQEQRLRRAQGQVAFNDNIAAFDALSDAQTLSICAVAILSFDDVAMHDNQVTVDTLQDLVPINTVVLGFFSCRVQGNRFRETFNPRFQRQTDSTANLPSSSLRTILSLASFGLLNASEMNQGTHCFLTIGLKKPRIVFVEERPVLDTNRHLIDEDVCEDFFEASTLLGTT